MPEAVGEARKAKENVAMRVQSPRETETEPFATVAKVSKMAHSKVNRAVERKSKRVIDLVERIMIDVLESCDSDYSMVFVHCAIWNALQDSTHFTRRHRDLRNF